MREAMVYVPAELGPPGPDAPAWVERIKDRLAKPGARMLFDLLVDCAGGSIGRAIRGSHGWLAHCFTTRWVEERPGLDPRDYPSPQMYRRALAEVLSAGLVRVVGRGDRCEFWLLAPLRPPPQQVLPFDPPDDLDEAPAVSAFKPRLYDPDSLETNNDVRPAADLPAIRVAPLVATRPVEPIASAPALAPSVAKPADDGASWLAAYRAARQARSSTTVSAQAAALPNVRKDSKGPLVAHSERPQTHGQECPAPTHQGVLGAKVAPAPTSTCLKSTYTNTYTSARGPTPVGDSAEQLVQEWLPLDLLSETPQRAVEWLARLRRIDPSLWLGPVVTIRCAIDLGRLDAAKVEAVIACAESGVDRQGKPIGNAGGFLMSEWKKLVKAAGLQWLSVAPPKVRREADRLATELGLAAKVERTEAPPPLPKRSVSAAASRFAATRRLMASWENRKP